MRGSTWRRGAVVVLLTLVTMIASAPEALAAPPSTGADTDVRYALRVLRYVPDSYRGTCEVRSADQHFAGVAAQGSSLRGAVVCIPEPGLYAYFTQFSTEAAMDAAFDSYVIGDSFGEFPEESDCGGDGTYDVGGEAVGRWACYLQDPTKVAGGVPGVQTNWTDIRSNILATAVRTDGDADALSEWWNSSDAGPLGRPSDAGVPAPLTAAEQRRVGRRLLRTVPKQHRATCELADVNQRDDVGQEAFESRLFIRGMLRCVPTEGTDAAFYFAFEDGDIARGYVEKFENGVDLGAGADDCPASGSYGVGRKKDVGAYVCWFPTDTAGAAMVWSNDALAVVGTAVRDDGDADALMEWWRESGGPIT